ncbi:MAG: internal scaffolding protein [Microvirus sp.]|nr:MAG: internal scaffolding protein [Microvirus sp.]
MEQLTIHSYFNPPHHPGESNNEPSMTQQHYAEETDINFIMARFLKTGLLNQIEAGTYEDVSQAEGYRESLHILKNADEQFATLPAAVRKKFENSPLNFLEFMHNPDNKNIAEELGLLMPQKASPTPTNTTQIINTEA